MKDSEVATLVNRLRDIATEYRDTQQLRERIAAELPKARAVEGDLFGSIGAGLARDAARRFGQA